jgi:cytochrome c oxidase cbb3-type subunit 3
MSSPFRTDLGLAGAAALALALAACGRTTHQPESSGPPGGSGLVDVPASGLVPGGGHLPDQPDPRARPYYNNAEAVGEGMRLFKQFNCTGCHFNGGGGNGPPLMDDSWIYGGRIDQIFNSIYQGRPNGMPAWGGKIPEPQIWEIATYVRSMSLPATLAANGTGTPSQHPAPVPPEADMQGGWKPPDSQAAQPPSSQGSGGQRP